MANGMADYAFLEITAAAIAAASATVWTKVGSLSDCLALMCLNNLDQGFLLKFSSKQGESAPATSSDPHYSFAAGEPMFVNYKNVGNLFNSCDVYVRKLASAPTTGSFRMTGIKMAPLKFKG